MLIESMFDCATGPSANRAVLSTLSRQRRRNAAVNAVGMAKFGSGGASCISGASDHMLLSVLRFLVCASGRPMVCVKRNVAMAPVYVLAVVSCHCRDALTLIN